MSDSDKDSNDQWLQGTSLNRKRAAKNTSIDLLPLKSKKNYESTYETFVKWKKEQKMKMTSESVVLSYFEELSQKYKPSTLWSMYSMLKATLKIKEKVDIDTYHTFKAFMKKQSSGFISKQSNVFSAENITKFLSEASDNKYLATKVALIFGITGACRSNELVNIQLEDITKQGDLLVVDLPTTRTKKPRTFVIAEEFTKTIQKYMDLRPENAKTDRFFLNFQKGKCTPQVIGIHKFSKMPTEIATYLKLDDPKSYTGHAFRRTSAALLADIGTNILTFKHHGARKSSNVAESCIEASIKKEPPETDNIISMAGVFPSAVPMEQNTDDLPLNPQKVLPISSEKMNLNAQFTVDSDLNVSNKQNLIFNNCTVVIHQQ